MPSFKDAKDREWELKIDAPAIMAIRDDCDPDFLRNDFDEGVNNSYDRMLNDPVLLCRVVYHLTAKQRRERDITEEDFYMQVIGETIDAATEAMLKAILAFIPRRTGKLLETFAKQDQLRQQAATKAAAKMNDPEMEKKLMAIIENEMGAATEKLLTQLGSATGSPESSASTPAD